MFHCNVVNEFLNQHGFTDACAAEQSHFSAPCVWCQKVNDFNTGFENFHRRVLFIETGGIAVNTHALSVRRNGFPAVNGVSQHVEHTPQGILADRNHHGMSRRLHRHTAPHSLTSGEQDTADTVCIDVLTDFHHTGVFLSGQENVPDFRQIAVVKAHIHHRTGNLHNRSVSSVRFSVRNHCGRNLRLFL